MESVEEIRQRLQEVLTVLPPERLVVAPDCGLGFLPTEIARKNYVIWFRRPNRCPKVFVVVRG